MSLSFICVKTPFPTPSPFQAPIAADNEIDSDTWWGSTAPKINAAGGDEDALLTKQDIEYLIRANGGV